MSHYLQASDMRLGGFLVFPSSCNSEVKGWLVWLLGAGRCNGVRPFFYGDLVELVFWGISVSCWMIFWIPSYLV
jgi:hypothetical protein